MDADCKEHEKARDKIKKTASAKFADLVQKLSDSEKLVSPVTFYLFRTPESSIHFDKEQEADEFISKLDNLKKEEKERARRIKALEQEITRTKEELVKQQEVKPEKVEDLQVEMVCCCAVILLSSLNSLFSGS